MIEKELNSYTWRELETNGKFAKNDKLSFITDDMLIVGCDIGSETHYIRAIDVRGREPSRGAFEFSNTSEGFANARAWMQDEALEKQEGHFQSRMPQACTDHNHDKNSLLRNPIRYHSQAAKNSVHNYNQKCPLMRNHKHDVYALLQT